MCDLRDFDGVWELVQRAQCCAVGARRLMTRVDTRDALLIYWAAANILHAGEVDASGLMVTASGEPRAAGTTTSSYTMTTLRLTTNHASAVRAPRRPPCRGVVLDRFSVTWRRHAYEEACPDSLRGLGWECAGGAWYPTERWATDTILSQALELTESDLRQIHEQTTPGGSSAVRCESNRSG